MRLTASGDPTFSAEVATDQYGRFQFDDLAAGVYDVTQIQLLPQYISVTIGVGTLIEMTSGLPLGSGYGAARQYSQSQEIMPAVVSIAIPDETTEGVSYNFGQIWWGKFMYLGEDPGDPPGALPPPAGTHPRALDRLAIAIRKRLSPLTATSKVGIRRPCRVYLPLQKPSVRIGPYSSNRECGTESQTG